MVFFSLVSESHSVFFVRKITRRHGHQTLGYIVGRERTRWFRAMAQARASQIGSCRDAADRCATTKNKSTHSFSSRCSEAEDCAFTPHLQIPDRTLGQKKPLVLVFFLCLPRLPFFSQSITTKRYKAPIMPQKRTAEAGGGAQIQTPEKKNNSKDLFSKFGAGGEKGRGLPFTGVGVDNFYLKRVRVDIINR